ncbi:I78 family peptidase inhibitor [Pseudogemmobacter humi]|uniref:Peptidase inhibitor I78 family protein n=1 Tax=Pseudogemmobacter humi TaxID=2483812 RepID=A0A3P5WZM8_9RHOB|nr:I78 family peptidase inhibitor [Pseudogemmobacter humi]VDC27241.1 Peptidase inhibitor I78 family protein [Pseudogemmobacter humi]
MSIFRIAALVPLALAACVPVTPVDPGTPAFPVGAGDTCNAAPLVSLIGRDSSALATVGNRRDPMRVTRPGQAMTMDFNPARLNVELNAADRIVRLSCG